MGREGWRSLLRIGAGVAVLAAGLARGHACDLDLGPRLDVTNVIDGETLALSDGKAVRLVGILAPHASDAASAGSWPPAEAAIAHLRDRVLGKSVQLKSRGRGRDRYGRYLAHVYVETADGTRWLQEDVLRAGHGRAASLAGSEACLRELISAERVAREGKLGLWAQATYAVRDASRPADFDGARDRFVVAEGRVLKAAKASKGLYLNFGEDRYRDVSVLVANSLLKEDAQRTAALSAASGLRVRVRGWLDFRGGPFIAAASLDDIEILEGR